MLPHIWRMDSYSCSSIHLSEIAQDGVEMLDAVAEQCRGHHRDARARHHGFQHVLSTMNAACDRQVGVNMSEDDRDPMQPQQQFLGATQSQAGHDFEQFEIQIGLIEAIEQHQRVGAGAIESFRHVCEEH